MRLPEYELVHIGTFKTDIFSVDAAIGYFESELHLFKKTIEAEPSKKDYIYKEIGHHLRGLCERYSVQQDVWHFEPTQQVRDFTNLPERIPFG